MVIEDVVINQNSSLIDIKLDVFNENLKDSVLRMVVDSFYKIDAGWLYLKVALSKDVKTPDYSIILVNTVVDMKRMMNGVYASPILRTAYDELSKNVDFELKYPFAPVRNIWTSQPDNSFDIFAGPLHMQQLLVKRQVSPRIF